MGLSLLATLHIPKFLHKVASTYRYKGTNQPDLVLSRQRNHSADWDGEVAGQVAVGEVAGQAAAGELAGQVAFEELAAAGRCLVEGVPGQVADHYAGIACIDASVVHATG